MRKAARTDTGSKELRAYAESIGFTVVVLNTIVDCLLVFGPLTYIVDFKSDRGTSRGDLTPEQSKLVAKGVPIRFISTPAQIDALKLEAMVWRRS